MLAPDGELGVLLIVGVNGVGKTTSIAKLADYWKRQGQQGHARRRRHLPRRGDRSAEALGRARRRAGGRPEPGSDPGSVVFDAVAAARARGSRPADRRHRRPAAHQGQPDGGAARRSAACSTARTSAHVRTLLVLDASTGQNAIVQGRAFKEATGLDGLILAKLDGTAKGGVVFAIVDELEIPVLFVGTGEKQVELTCRSSIASKRCSLTRTSFQNADSLDADVRIPLRKAPGRLRPARPQGPPDRRRRRPGPARSARRAARGRRLAQGRPPVRRGASRRRPSARTSCTA